MLRKKALVAISVVAGILASVSQAQNTAPDRITVAGGATAMPLMIKVGEVLAAKSPQNKLPQTLNNSASAGFKLFCAGAGLESPSTTTSTRPMRADELESCRKNGVTDILELGLGRNALAFAQSSGSKLKEISRKDFFLAIAKDIPDPKESSKLIPNPYKNWKEINSAFPDVKIQVWGPDSAFGLFETYFSKIVLPGCRQVESIKNLEASDPKSFEAICKNFRKDGFYTEFTDITALIQVLKNNLDTLGVAPFTAILKGGLQALPLDRVEPNLINISREIYTATFLMRAYIKKSHIGLISGLKIFLAELTSEDAIGTSGYFYEMGVVPLPRLEREKMRGLVANP